jgi:hypothetical protein
LRFSLHSPSKLSKSRFGGGLHLLLPIGRAGGGARRRGPAPSASCRRRNRRLRASASVSEAADRTGPTGPDHVHPQAWMGPIGCWPKTNDLAGLPGIRLGTSAITKEICPCHAYKPLHQLRFSIWEFVFMHILNFHASDFKSAPRASAGCPEASRLPGLAPLPTLPIGCVASFSITFDGNFQIRNQIALSALQCWKARIEQYFTIFFLKIRSNSWICRIKQNNDPFPALATEHDRFEDCPNESGTKRFEAGFEYGSHRRSWLEHTSMIYSSASMIYSLGMKVG